VGVVSCFSCGKEFTFSEKVGLRAECEHCRSDVHVCCNCEFYDVKVYNQCRETQAEIVRDRDRANRCDYFQPRKGASGGVDKAAQLKAAAEALFKKKSP
jgi:hypothetical protein